VFKGRGFVGAEKTVFEKSENLNSATKRDPQPKKPSKFGILFAL
jgi:hypothetical protein